MSGRSTWTFSSASWHGRLYQYWRSHAEFKCNEKYTENLCHYCRVVVFWGPLAVFIHAKHKRFTWLRPWLVTLVLAGVTAYGVSLAFHTGKTLDGTVAVLGTLAVTGLIILLGFWVERNRANIGKWLQPKLMYIKRQMDKLSPVRSCIRFFFTCRIATIRVKKARIPVYPFMATMIPAYCCWLTLDSATALLVGFQVLAVVGSTIAIIVGALALIVIAGPFKDKLNEKKREKIPRTDPTFLQVSYGFARAKKHRVCPLIEVSDD